MNWAVANLLSDSTEASAPYRYNAGSWVTSRAGGETFRLGSINLFNYRHESHVGPKFYSLSDFNRRAQPPHSNRYVTLGRKTGDVPLRVTAPAGNRVTVVVKE